MPGWLACLKDFSVLSYSCFIIIFAFSIPNWQRIILSFVRLDINAENHEEFYSSVYCRGNNHTDRLCRFKNLCYNPATDAFLFFHNSKSDVIGVPDDRFSPALVDFSSVYDHNTQYFNFIDLPSSAFSNFSAEFVSGIAILFKRFNPENLMHVFHDDLIPAYVTIKETFLLNDKSAFFAFADGREPGPYADLYEKILDKPSVYLNVVSQLLCFESSVVGLNKHSLWYQYGFRQPQGALNKDMNSISSTLAQFRRYFKKQFLLNEVALSNTALLLTRGHNRKILNSKALAKTVEVHTNLKTHIASLEQHSVIEVIKKIMSSKLVIGMHGSLLILSLFLPPNSHIIELFPYGINPNICTPYKTLAEVPGLKLTYHSWENKKEQNSFPHPDYPPDHGGIKHLPLHVQEHIKNSIVKPFLCCYNPEWLYRIYQDTIVDIGSFTAVINDFLHNNKKTVINEDYKIKLLPSEVQNISCHLTSQNVYTISWDKPWNVNFMNATMIEYELWYQDNNEDDDIKAFIMHKTSFSFHKSLSNAYVWIRCHVDERIGPFNTDPFICQ